MRVSSILLFLSVLFIAQFICMRDDSIKKLAYYRTVPLEHAPFFSLSLL